MLYMYRNHLYLYCNVMGGGVNWCANKIDRQRKHIWIPGGHFVPHAITLHFVYVIVSWTQGKIKICQHNYILYYINSEKNYHGQNNTIKSNFIFHFSTDFVIEILGQNCYENTCTYMKCKAYSVSPA